MKILLTKFCLFNLLLIFWVDMCAQSDSLKIDSLKKVLLTEKEDTNKANTLYALGLAYNVQNNYFATIKTLLAASKIGEQTGDKPGTAKSFLSIGMTYRTQGNYPDALKYLYAALNLFEQLKSKKDIANCLLNIGFTNSLQGNYSEALKNYQTALKISEEVSDKNTMAWLLQMIGNINQGEGNETEALKNYFSSLKIREELGDKVGMGQSNAVISQMYAIQRNYSEALRRDSIALKIYKELGDKAPNWGLPMCIAGIAGTYELQGDFNDSSGYKLTAKEMYSQAEINFITSLKLWQKTGNKVGIANLEARLGDIYVKQKKFTLSRDYFEKALQTYKETGTKIEIQNTYQNLSNLDSIQGNYKQAYEHYHMYILYRDSIFSEETTKKSVQVQMQYELDKKEAVAKAAQNKKDADSRRIKNQQYFTIAALGIVVLAVIIIALIQFRNNKHKQKANVALQQQKEKVESTLSELKSTQAQLIQSEKMASLGELTAGIAHEIQNPLNFVNNFSEVNTELIDEAGQEIGKGNIEEVKIILNDIKDNEEKINHHGKRADAIVKGMLQHSRSSSCVKEPTDINALCDEYIRLSYHGLRAKDKSFNATIKTDFDESLTADEAGIGKINIIPQDIGRVILNLLTNAFYVVDEKKKSGIQNYDPTVSVSTKNLKDKVEVEVKDNRNGIPQKVLDKIFQPFFTTKPTGHGTGLGLSMSYDIIKAHGGEIKVQTKENEGTTFIIELPVI